MTRDRRNKPNTKFERLSFAGKYSMKNIPVPSNNKEYMKKLIAQMEKIIKRMRWKALFFLKDEEKYKSLIDSIEFFERKETYGFNTPRKPPFIKDLESFENSHLFNYFVTFPVNFPFSRLKSCFSTLIELENET